MAERKQLLGTFPQKIAAKNTSSSHCKLVNLYYVTQGVYSYRKGLGQDFLLCPWVLVPILRAREVLYVFSLVYRFSVVLQVAMEIL